MIKERERLQKERVKAYKLAYHGLLVNERKRLQREGHTELHTKPERRLELDRTRRAVAKAQRAARCGV